MNVYHLRTVIIALSSPFNSQTASSSLAGMHGEGLREGMQLSLKVHFSEQIKKQKVAEDSYSTKDKHKESFTL